MSGRVVLIEPFDDLRIVLTDALRQAGFTCVPFRSATEAVRHWGVSKCVVLADDDAAFELQHILSTSALARLPLVVLTTGKRTPSPLAKGTLLKPFDVHGMVDQLRRFCSTLN